MLENGKILQERYAIEKQIGKGGMGTVYLAVDQRFGNHVALKETFYSGDEEFGAAFEREACLLNGLQHSVLPHVTDYFTENGEHYLVMQYIEGEDLLDSLKREKHFPIETVLHWTDNLLDALEYLHSQNPPIIHRDIKPQNLKITTRGNIVLLDFGLAKLKNDDSTTRSVFGYSRRYSPLEQIQGTGTDARSDIFSLAATAYHLLTGEPPIDALDRAAAIISGKPDPLRNANEIRNEVPSEIADFLNKALALNAGERFESANAMRETLKNFLNYGADIENSKPSETTIETENIVKDSSDAKQISPAFAAFAATNKSDLPEDETINKSSSSPFSEERFSALPPVDDATDVQPEIAAPRRKSNLPLVAAGLILLLVAGLTAGYFINKSDAFVQTTENPTANANTKISETNSILPEQTMALSAGANSENEKETKTEKTATAPVKKETVSRNNSPEAPREPSRNNGETRQRIVEDKPILVDDVSGEEIDRQQRRQERRRRQQERRRQRAEDNDDKREKRRRQNRRRGQNDDYFPF